jgi:O-methyltransferase involved in polyketide biosynthesis
VKKLAVSTFETKSHSSADNEYRSEGKVVDFSPGKGQVRLGKPPQDDWSESEQRDGIAPNLADVSETMLWALHNRASEARRRDGVLVDPDSVRIHDAIDYDFARHFGDPAGSLASRAAEIDRALRQWLERHPDGFVVSLGEGLETQGRRVDNGRMRWLSVDLPDAMRLRERFLTPTDRFRHSAVSALDPDWMDTVDPSSGVFIVAQGLLMYLEPEAVRELLAGIADRFPGAEMVFDVVPRWFSHLTLLGLYQTPHYRLPPMPWGINRDEIEPMLRRWHLRIANVAFLDYRVPRGLSALLDHMIHHIPVVRNEVPSLVHVTMATTVCRSAVIPDTDSLGATASACSFDKPGLSFNDMTAPRRQPMTSISASVTGTGTIGDMFAIATRNANTGGDLAITAGQIIATRVALGIAAAMDPLRADHAEFGRMVPEKVEAFSAAGMIMLEQSGQANRQMTRLASDAAMTTARATIAMTGCSSPVALVQAQSRFALEWFNRAASDFIAMGMLALGAQEAAMLPIQQTVFANAERLGR